MSLEDKAEELRKTLGLIEKCYLQNFMGDFLAVAYSCRSYLNGDSSKAKRASEVFGLISAHFDGLPLEELSGNLDFQPVLDTREHLVRYGKILEIFLESPTEELRNQLTQIYQAAYEAGKPFRRLFDKSLKELKSIPGNEDYVARVKTIEGVVWKR